MKNLIRRSAARATLATITRATMTRATRALATRALATMALAGATLLPAVSYAALQQQNQQPSQQRGQQQASPDLTGIAHVAIRVADLERSRDFFRKLGFEEAFAMTAGGSPSEAFFKINDLQFIELYPRHNPTDGVGFMHVCFQSPDINALHQDYVDHGLTPIPVLRAGAGNLLFTLQGPDQPPPIAGLRKAATQNIEYTQYMPGSKHTLDRGKHLGPDRVAQTLAGAGIPMADPGAATAWYEQKLGFQSAQQSLEKGLPALSLPGAPQERIELLPPPKPALKNMLPFRIFFSVPDLGAADKKLRSLDLHPKKRPGEVVIHDPDGNEIVFIAASAQ